MPSFKDQVIDLVFPTYCIRCEKSGGEVLCGACLAGMASTSALVRHDIPIGNAGHTPCFSGLKYAGPYYGVLKEMVLKFKSSAKPYGAPLARLMLAAAGNDPDFIAPDAVCYVPSERKKIAQRGYNPAELLAGKTARLVGRPLVHPLKKTKRTPDQDTLPGARRWDNVSDAFTASANFKRGSRFLLVDDVFTTGATADACASALLESGAGSVHVLVAARAVFYSSLL